MREVTSEVNVSRKRKLLIVAGNQAELYHLAETCSEHYEVKLVRPPAFRFLGLLLKRRPKRSQYKFRSTVNVREVGHVYWLCERITARLDSLKKFHGTVLRICFLKQSKATLAIALDFRPDLVVANFFQASSLIKEGYDVILNYPFVAPDFELFSQWSKSKFSSEKEGFMVDDSEKYRLEYEIANSKLILVGSGYAKRSLASASVDQRKIAVVPYGVDTEIFYPGDRKELADKCGILFVGPRSFRKGADVVECAFRHLASTGRYRLSIVGRGWDEFCRSFENDELKYYGVVGQKRLAQLFREHSVVLMPSRAEGMGLVGLEAMACGCCIIATNRGPDAYLSHGKDGIIVDSFDPEDWINVIVALSKNKIHSLSAAAVEKAANMTWTEYGKRVRALLEHSLESTNFSRPFIAND